MPWLTGYAAAVRNSPAILVTILVASAVALAACKDRAVERMEAVKREVCACKDAACADQAMNRVTAGSIKSNARTQALARDMVECRARLEAADRPNTDPDAEGSDQSADDPPAGQGGDQTGSGRAGGGRAGGDPAGGDRAGGDPAGDQRGSSGATGSAGSARLPDRSK